MGRIPLRGERPSSDSTRPSRSPPGVFIMRKAVAAIRRRNTLSAVPLAIQKPAGQANNPAYRRLQCFFVLTKGMSVVGPRPALPNEVATYNDYQRQRLLVKPGMTCYWQTRRNRDWRLRMRPKRPQGYTQILPSENRAVGFVSAVFRCHIR